MYTYTAVGPIVGLSERQGMGCRVPYSGWIKGKTIKFVRMRVSSNQQSITPHWGQMTLKRAYGPYTLEYD